MPRSFSVMANVKNDTLMAQLTQKVAGTIKNGSITTDESISTTGMSLTLKLKSTFEHEDSNGETYEMDYEITLTASFHNLTGTLPVGISDVQLTTFEKYLSQLEENANEVYTYLNTERELVATTLIEILGAGATVTGSKENTTIITEGAILCVVLVVVGAALV